MKKVLIVSVLAISTLVASAQVNFGLKTGVNFSTLGGDDFDEVDGKKSNTGFYFGGIVNVPFSENFAFQPELVFSSKQGVEFREDPNIEYNLNLAYLNIPLMLQYRNSGFIAEAGPQIGFLMSAKSKISAGGQSDEEDVKDSFKGIDFGINLGLGYQFSNGFGINGRYNFGMSNIVDETDADTKNRVLSVGIFYMFGGKKAK